MEMTYHVAVQRADRVKHIVEEIGIGQVVKEKYIGYGIGGQAGRYICLTDTGITIIKDEQKLKMITMYVTTQKELVGFFGVTKKIPSYLKKKVGRNQSKYTAEGKTIWK